MGFKASFGRLSIANLAEEFFPLIALRKSGEALVILTAPVDGRIDITDPISRKKEQISIKDYKSEFSDYAIIVKELNDREKEERLGHWFFSAFRKSKWIYFQVMIAAMVSNFLSLTTALFTMTVYDRIIPNSAIESLYALSVGVLFALGCDFIIKMLRARFIDVASKRADLIVSRKLFDRILSFDSNERKQSTGALAGIVKEFETLREFFTSSTLVIIVDLPFVFFFVYVISLIAGPLGYIPLFCVPLVVIAGLIVQPFLARTVRAGMRSRTLKDN